MCATSIHTLSTVSTLFGVQPSGNVFNNNTHDILEAEILPKSRINCVVMVTCLMVPSINSTGVDNGPQKFGFCLTPSRECTRGVAAKETHTSRKGNRICRVRYLVPIVLFLILYVYISCLSLSLCYCFTYFCINFFCCCPFFSVCALSEWKRLFLHRKQKTITKLFGRNRNSSDTFAIRYSQSAMAMGSLPSAWTTR